MEERRARLAVRHHLAPGRRAGTIVEAARDIVCLHATDPSTVYLSAWARAPDLTIEAVDRVLYEDRLLVRMLAMRRTMFVVPVEDAPILHAAASLAIARAERKRNEDLVVLLGVDDPAAWLREAENAARAALERRGEATARELAEDVPALRQKVRVNVGKRYEGEIGMSSRVLLLLALEGKVVRGRPRGTWLSSQYRWAPMTQWIGRSLPELPAADAQAEVVRRWLARFGPGTEADWISPRPFRSKLMPTSIPGWTRRAEVSPRSWSRSTTRRRASRPCPSPPSRRLRSATAGSTRRRRRSTTSATRSASYRAVPARTGRQRTASSRGACCRKGG
jgi:Winged helix DNA-binding domain